MTQSNGRRGTIYEQVLDYARREIDEASSKIDELRRTLGLLEARVEAAKSVYEAVAARLNLEDGEEEGAEVREAPYLEAPLPLQAQEPPEEVETVQDPGNGSRDTQEGFSAELIRRHLEQQAERAAAQEEPPEAPDPVPFEASEASETPEVPEPEEAREPEVATGFPGLSEADRQLIGEYLRSKREG